MKLLKDLIITFTAHTYFSINYIKLPFISIRCTQPLTCIHRCELMHCPETNRIKQEVCFTFYIWFAFTFEAYQCYANGFYCYFSSLGFCGCTAALLRHVFRFTNNGKHVWLLQTLELMHEFWDWTMALLDWPKFARLVASNLWKIFIILFRSKSSFRLFRLTHILAGSNGLKLQTS